MNIWEMTGLVFSLTIWLFFQFGIWVTCILVMLSCLETSCHLRVCGLVTAPRQVAGRAGSALGQRPLNPHWVQPALGRGGGNAHHAGSLHFSGSAFFWQRILPVLIFTIVAILSRSWARCWGFEDEGTAPCARNSQCVSLCASLALCTCSPWVGARTHGGG